MTPNQGLLPGHARCPYCNSMADGYTSTGDKEAPLTGDITICLYCAQIGVYEVKDGLYSVRKPSREELGKFFTEIPDLQKKVNWMKRFAIEQQKKNN